MKFNKNLIDVQNSILLEPLKDSMLPYKYWKKYIKKNRDNMDLQEIVATLEKQCKQTEDNFIKELSQSLNSSVFLCCRKDNSINQDISEELIKFSDINRLALYKICKKLQKNGANNLMQYYSSANFKFINSYELMYLKMQTENEHECPICMENAKYYIIMDCSHYMCVGCLLKITNTEKLNATTYNKVLIGMYKFYSCPFCRKKNPLNPLKQLNKYHFYPCIPK